MVLLWSKRIQSSGSFMDHMFSIHGKLRVKYHSQLTLYVDEFIDSAMYLLIRLENMGELSQSQLFDTYQ